MLRVEVKRCESVKNSLLVISTSCNFIADRVSTVVLYKPYPHIVHVYFFSLPDPLWKDWCQYNKIAGGLGGCWKEWEESREGVGEASTPFYINAAKMQARRRTGSWVAASEGFAVCLLLVLSLLSFSVCIIAVHANRAMLQGSRTINRHI